MQLILNGVAYPIVVSALTLSQLEQQLARSATLLAEELAQGVMRFDDMLAIVRILVAPAYRGDNLAEELLDAGVSQVADVLAAYFLAVLGGTQAAGITREEMRALMQAFP